MAESVILLVEKSAAQRTRIQRALADSFPEADWVAVNNLKMLETRLQLAPPDCFVISARIARDEADMEELCQLLQSAAPRVPVLWIFPKGDSLAPWLHLMDGIPGDVLFRPFDDQELALRLGWCLASAIDDPGLRQANRVLKGLVEVRSQDLYESDERYRLLFNACGDGVFSVILGRGRNEGRIVEVNTQICHALNYPREELLALLPKDLLEPSQVRYVTERLRNLETHKLMYLETVLVTRDGQKIPAALTARHFSFSRQPYIVFVVRFKQRLHHGSGSPEELDHAYRTYAAQTGQIMYEYLIPNGTLRLTGAAWQITGLTLEELESSDRDSWLRLIHRDDRTELLDRIQQAMAEVGQYQMQYRIRHTSGEFRHVEDLGIVLPDESGVAHRLLGYVRDVTERVRAEQAEQLIEQEIQHSKRLESLGVLAGGIAHDFNNILAAIIGLTDMSIQELDGPPDVLEDLRESLSAAHRAKELVKQILAFSRQTGEERSPVYLHVVVREALGLLRASMPASVSIIDSIDVQSGMVMANPTQMHQVVMNYCTNGIQAMSDRGGALEVRLDDVEVTPRFAATHPKLQPGPYVRLVVSDKGHGIEPGNIKRIFDPFFTTKGPGEGTGMGLAMVYGIVADHGGAVLVESVVGQGTEFHTYLPRSEAAQGADAPNAAAPSGGRESILIVDDERAVRRFCQRSLSPQGYRVHVTGEPRSALEEFKKDPAAYDLIITDQHMPGMTGDALAKRIRKLRPEIPIILFTGFSSELLDDDLIRANISEIVPKPVLAAQLTTAIRRVLDGVG